MAPFFPIFFFFTGSRCSGFSYSDFSHSPSLFQAFNKFYISEHKNLLDLSKEVGAVKRSFGEVRTSTHHELEVLKEHFGLVSRRLKAACVAAQGDLDSIPSDQKVRKRASEGSGGRFEGSIQAGSKAIKLTEKRIKRVERVVGGEKGGSSSHFSPGT